MVGHAEPLVHINSPQHRRPQLEHGVSAHRHVYGHSYGAGYRCGISWGLQRDSGLGVATCAGKRADVCVGMCISMRTCSRHERARGYDHADSAPSHGHRRAHGRSSGRSRRVALPVHSCQQFFKHIFFDKLDGVRLPVCAAARCCTTCIK